MGVGVGVVEVDLIEIRSIMRIHLSEIMDFLEVTDPLKKEMLRSLPKDVGLVGHVLDTVVVVAVVSTVEKVQKGNALEGYLKGVVELVVG